MRAAWVVASGRTAIRSFPFPSASVLVAGGRGRSYCPPSGPADGPLGGRIGEAARFGRTTAF